MDTSVKDIRKNYKAIKVDTAEIRAATAATIAPALELIKSYPATSADLLKQNRKEDKEKLYGVVTTLARDIDKFQKDLVELDSRTSPILSREATKKQHMAKDYTNLLSLGVQYSEVATRVAGSVNNALVNYTEIVGEEGVDK